MGVGLRFRVLYCPRQSLFRHVHDATQRRRLPDKSGRDRQLQIWCTWRRTAEQNVVSIAQESVGEEPWKALVIPNRYIPTVPRSQPCQNRPYSSREGHVVGRHPAAYLYTRAYLQRHILAPPEPVARLPE